MKTQFQDIISNPSKYPLMESAEDNGQLVYNTSATSNYYPTAGIFQLATAVSMEQGMADTLKE